MSLVLLLNISFHRTPAVMPLLSFFSGFSSVWQLKMSIIIVMQKPVWAPSISILAQAWCPSDLCKTANWNNQAEYLEDKRLQESCTISVPTEFNESDFDKPIIFVSLTIAHVTVPSLVLLSVLGVKNSIFYSYTRSIGTAYCFVQAIGGFRSSATLVDLLNSLAAKGCGGRGLRDRGGGVSETGRTPLCFKRGERSLWHLGGGGVRMCRFCPDQMWAWPARPPGRCPCATILSLRHDKQLFKDRAFRACVASAVMVSRALP